MKTRQRRHKHGFIKKSIGASEPGTLARYGEKTTPKAETMKAAKHNTSQPYRSRDNRAR